jgi:hypothetical protein
MLDNNQILEYISLGKSSGFYGYGNWSNDIYIIGIEEAGCYSESLIQQKLNKYFVLNIDNSGVFDNRSFQYSLTDSCDPKLKNYSDFFDGNLKKGGYVPKIATLLKILENLDIDKYEYVRNNFGARKSNHSIIEILPLPCPKISDWFYKSKSWVDINGLKFMSSKSKYRREIISIRTSFIKSKINETKNKKLIIFLANGNDKIEYWNKISPININMYKSLFKSIKYHIDNKKMFVLLPFPGSPSSNGVFNSSIEIENVALKIRSIFESIK